jgi:hypothetical protein
MHGLCMMNADKQTFLTQTGPTNHTQHPVLHLKKARTTKISAGEWASVIPVENMIMATSLGKLSKEMMDPCGDKTPTRSFQRSTKYYPYPGSHLLSRKGSCISSARERKPQKSFEGRGYQHARSMNKCLSLSRILLSLGEHWRHPQCPFIIVNVHFV